MELLESLKHLFKNSPLFAEGPAARGQPPKKKRGGRGAVKMGQGGTLDPLADGVLGEQQHAELE